MLDEALAEYREQGVVSLPSWFPLAVADKLITRTATGLGPD